MRITIAETDDDKQQGLYVDGVLKAKASISEPLTPSQVLEAIGIKHFVVYADIEGDLPATEESIKTRVSCLSSSGFRTKQKDDIWNFFETNTDETSA